MAAKLPKEQLYPASEPGIIVFQCLWPCFDFITRRDVGFDIGNDAKSPFISWAVRAGGSSPVPHGHKSRRNEKNVSFRSEAAGPGAAQPPATNPKICNVHSAQFTADISFKSPSTYFSMSYDRPLGATP
ncbi:hypothetical protein GWI33_018637 [Rhynchophorus ferrugineus]|uniref:Uncharacterized protein n=1 Tax=Rhynchophorus ferrugineus TaxID=354439 RepID=A0A834HTA3_RHYFE|nr:hypothetical protein GWI33_018637 [Rhynchophorus ferrugineus]